MYLDSLHNPVVKQRELLVLSTNRPPYVAYLSFEYSFEVFPTIPWRVEKTFPYSYAYFPVCSNNLPTRAEKKDRIIHSALDSFVSLIDAHNNISIGLFRGGAQCFCLPAGHFYRTPEKLGPYVCECGPLVKVQGPVWIAR